MTGCPFCAIAADEELQSYSSRRVVAFPSKPARRKGHLLFIPRAHIANANANPGLAGHVFEIATRFAVEMGQPFQLTMNNGSPAGQTVFHLHVHYLPH